MSPAQQLVQALLERRAAGIPFEFAWSVSLEDVRWPEDAVTRAQWRHALRWAREEFRDAYEHPSELPAHVQRVLTGRGALLELARAQAPLRLLGTRV